jgi:hypothetical protein
MKNGKMAGAFDCLHERVLGRTKMKNIAQKVVLRWIRQALTTGFTIWYERVVVARRAQNVENNVLLCWTHQDLSGAFENWRSQT